MTKMCFDCWCRWPSWVVDSQMGSRREVTQIAVGDYQVVVIEVVISKRSAKEKVEDDQG